MKKEEICTHCGKPIAIRNPSGYCDHLYYPDNCKICKRRKDTLENRRKFLKAECGFTDEQVFEFEEGVKALPTFPFFVCHEGDCDSPYAVEGKNMFRTQKEFDEHSKEHHEGIEEHERLSYVP